MIKIEEHKEKIRETRERLAEAKGPRHRRDLKKHLFRLENQLKAAERYIGESKKEGGVQSA